MRACREVTGVMRRAPVRLVRRFAPSARSDLQLEATEAGFVFSLVMQKVEADEIIAGRASASKPGGTGNRACQSSAAF